MTNFEIDVMGKLSAIEFVLEVVLANELAQQPERSSEQLKRDMMDREGYIRKGPVDVAHLEKIRAAFSDSLANFLNKVTERESEIRARAG